MGPSRINRTVLAWESTIGMMKAHGVRVQRSCACGLYGVVDLDHMARVLGGEDMSLWDCKPPCPLCGKLMMHMVSAGPGTPFRPMVSDPGDHEAHPLPAQAWMPGWTGRFF